MGFFALLPARAWASIGLVLALAGFAGWGYFHILDSGMATCEARHIKADAVAAEKAHQLYLAEVKRGDELAAKLVVTQRDLNEKQNEYLAYANAITGVCDPSVRVLVEHASGAKVGVPEAPSKPAGPATAEGATDLAYQADVTRAIGANIATNYSRLDQCLAGFNALIDWHSQPETMK